MLKLPYFGSVHSAVTNRSCSASTLLVSSSVGAKRKAVKTSGRALLVLFLPVLLVGCASSGANSVIDIAPKLAEQNNSVSKPVASNPSNPVQILAGDVLQVQFPFKPELGNSHKVRVDGYISLPYLGDVLAAGSSLAQLQETVAAEYMKLAQQELDVRVEDKEYRIQAGDTLAIRFPNKPELDETVIVRPDGRISLPSVNSVISEGKTPEALSAELAERFAEFVNRPEPVVIVKEVIRQQYYANGQLIRNQYADLRGVVILSEAAPRHIYVGGEVVRPGMIPINGPVTALQAILMSGGNKKTAEMKQVAIIRKSSSNQAQLILRNLQSGAVNEKESDNQVLSAALNDLALQANDIVIVPQTKISRVGDFLDQYVYNLVPFLRNSSLGFAYALNPVDEIRTTNTENVVITTAQ